MSKTASLTQQRRRPLDLGMRSRHVTAKQVHPERRAATQQRCDHRQQTCGSLVHLPAVIPHDVERVRAPSLRSGKTLLAEGNR